MKIELWFVFTVLLIHWIADFVLQTDWQAKNKSSNNIALLRHTGVYSICWIPFGWQFVLITFACHTVTDYFTSRLNTKLWKAGEIHFFFVSVGFDQALHYLQLLLTWIYLNPKQ